MTSPDAVPSADAAEQQLPAAGEELGPEPPPPGTEAAEADALEQAQPAGPVEHRLPAASAGDLPLEADTADAAEQSVVVPLDEDEGRS